jgi:hypothetical protein
MKIATTPVLAIAATFGASAGLSSCGQNDILRNADLGTVRYNLSIDSPAEALLAVRTYPPGGARERSGFFEPDCKQLVIQVDMVHGHPQLTDHKLPFAEHMQRVRQITEHLAIILGTPRIYSDGATAEGLALIKEEFDRTAKTIPDPSDIQIVDFRCRAYPLIEAHLLYGNIVIQPTESAEIFNDRMHLVNSGAWAVADLYNEMREDYALDQIAASSTPVAITVFGAAHDLTPNIQVWNQQNPQRKFSYLRLRPDDLPLDDDELLKWIEKNEQH